MPNWCSGEIRVRGSKESKRKFLNLFLLESEEANRTKQRYFARSWLSTTLEEIENQLNNEVLIFCVEVAWSIYTCMFKGYPNGESCPTIMEISKELELDIQIASDEQGLCFTEFYHIKNGKLLIEEVDNFETSGICRENYNSDDDYYEASSSWYAEVYEKFTEEFW